MKPETTIPKFLLMFLLTFTSLLQVNLTGQVIAGEEVSGLDIIHHSIELVRTLNDSDTIAYLDIDDDGADDLKIQLWKGEPQVDGPNIVIFYSLENKYSFCQEIFSGKMILYSAGDTLCQQEQIWSTDSVNSVRCYGSWGCMQETPNHEYIAYRRNSTSEIGWLKVSMSLSADEDFESVTFSISEYLGHSTSGIQNEIHNKANNTIIPNPTMDGDFSITNIDLFSRIEIFDASGKLLSTFSPDEKGFSLPSSRGIYFVRLYASGYHVIKMVIRL